MFFRKRLTHGLRLAIDGLQFNANNMQDFLTEAASAHHVRDEDLPLLSVLCLTYNHERFILKALDSFLMQETSFPIEIVIGEDRSSDNTLAMIEDYRNRFPKIIRLITSETNVGVTENFRRTLNACRGRYIALCEGDDYWEDRMKLQRQVEFLESNQSFVITYHDAYVLDGVSEKSFQLPQQYRCDATKDELINARPLSTLTVCFRNILSEIPSEFNHAPMLDLCLWSLLGQHGEGKYLGHLKPAIYRAHEGGIFSHQNESTKLRMTMRTYSCLAQYYENRAQKETSQNFTLKIASIAGSQLNTWGRLKLIGMLVDEILGNRLYLMKRWLIRR